MGNDIIIKMFNLAVRKPKTTKQHMTNIPRPVVKNDPCFSKLNCGFVLSFFGRIFSVNVKAPMFIAQV